MKASGIVAIVVALLLPVILFVALLNNYNEGHPIVVFATCIALWLIAGFVSSTSTGWRVAAVCVGLLQAALLCYAV